MSNDQDGCEWVNVVLDKRPLNGCVCVCFVAVGWAAGRASGL